MVVAYHLCSVYEFKDFFMSESVEYTLKNSILVIDPINLSVLQENTNEMLS